MFYDETAWDREIHDEIPTICVVFKINLHSKIERSLHMYSENSDTG